MPDAISYKLDAKQHGEMFSRDETLEGKAYLNIDVDQVVFAAGYFIAFYRAKD